LRFQLGEPLFAVGDFLLQELGITGVRVESPIERKKIVHSFIAGEESKNREERKD
jgi:hypothetical protein